MDIGAMYLEGLLTIWSGMVHRGFTRHDPETGTNIGNGWSLAAVVSQLIPAYSYIAPAVSHSFWFYGTTMFTAAALMDNLDIDPLAAFAIPVLGAWAIGASHIYYDVGYKKLAWTDKLQWAADFIAPLGVVAHYLSQY